MNKFNTLNINIIKNKYLMSISALFFSKQK